MVLIVHRRTRWIWIVPVIVYLSVVIPSTLGYCSIATSEAPSFMELAERADLILIGKVIDVEVREKNTITTFQVSEYIKEKNTAPEFTLKLPGGSSMITRPSSPTFELDKEYLLFLMDENLINLMNDDKSYYLLFDHYGKIPVSIVDIESLNSVIRKSIKKRKNRIL